MKKLLTICAIVCALLVSCGKENPLVGKWNLVSKNFHVYLQAEFTSEGDWSIRSVTDVREGTYELKPDGKTLVIREVNADPKTFKVLTVDEKNLVLKDENGEMTFKAVQ